MFEKYLLDNGITVIMEKMEYVRSVAFGVFVKNGSRNENINNNGISHFIEHMMFKGTEKRTAQDIAQEMDSIGGQLNAFTTKEYTCYYARVLDSHFDVAFDMISDMFFNSKFADSDIKKEARVITEEISMYEDAPDDVVFDKLQYNVWKEDSLGLPILGTAETINGFNHEILKKYFDENYCADNTVIAVAGNFDINMVKEKIESFFGGLNRRSNRQNIRKSEYKKSFVKVEKDIEQLHLAVAFEGIKLKDKYSYAMAVLNTIFGGGMSSRLFQRIREENGLAYTVYSFNSAYTDTGLYNIYAGMNPSQLTQVYSLIIEEIKKLKADKFVSENINKTKEQIKSNYMLSLESTSNRMSSIGRSMLLMNKVSTPEELLQKVDEVNEDMINHLIDTIFDLDKISVCVVGKNTNNINMENFM